MDQPPRGMHHRGPVARARATPDTRARRLSAANHALAHRAATTPNKRGLRRRLSASGAALPQPCSLICGANLRLCHVPCAGALAAWKVGLVAR